MNFKEGQKIMFELCSIDGYTNQPRYWWNVDKGATGRWATGHIESIEADKIVVSYTIGGYIGTGYCYFPYLMHKSYDPNQWKLEGYLQSGECECGSAACGYSSHSDWCSADAFLRRKDELQTL